MDKKEVKYYAILRFMDTDVKTIPMHEYREDILVPMVDRSNLFKFGRTNKPIELSYDTFVFSADRSRFPLDGTPAIEYYYSGIRKEKRSLWKRLKNFLRKQD